MAVRNMREVKPGEVPIDGGTAVQDDPGRPVFRGNGEYDYVNVAAEVSVQGARRPRAGE
jgi:hypothetical protein